MSTSWADQKSKISLVWIIVFSCSMQQQQTISQSDCDVWQKVDFIWQPRTTSSLAEPRSSSKALPKPKLAKKKKKSWSLFGSLLKVWPTMAFWIPAKPLHLRSTLSKLMRCTKNYKACSRHWSTKWPQFFSTTTRDQLFQSWMNRAMMLIQPPYSPDLSPEDYQFFKHLNNFLQRKCFHNQQEAENAFQRFTESWSMDFYIIGMSNLFSHWQKCADYSSSYFD